MENRVILVKGISMINLEYKALKEKHRAIRDGFPLNLSLRVHRSLSWLDRAEQTNDLDSKFIFLWISFNAAYAKLLDENENATEREQISVFFQTLSDFDKKNQIYENIWQTYPGPVRLLLSNKYIFGPFWKYQLGIVSKQEWERSFSSAQKVVNSALANKNTNLILSILFTRIYVLRNQIIHGGATWGSSVNRDQLESGCQILSNLVPIFINLMMDNPNCEWEAPAYPVVEE